MNKKDTLLDTSNFADMKINDFDVVKHKQCIKKMNTRNMPIRSFFG